MNIPEREVTVSFKPDRENYTSTIFIHASDIHLGSHQYRNSDRAGDYVNAFQEILLLAVHYKADFVLLGGDVFTSLEMLPGNLTKIIDLLTHFKTNTNSAIPIIAIEGNHDIRKFSRGIRFKQRGQSWLKLIASLGLIVLLDGDLELSPDHIFQPYDLSERRGGKIQVKNVMIYGTRYLGEKPVEQLSRMRKAIDRDDGLFHVLLQHFGIQGQMEGVPGINMEFIQHLKHTVHYLALGHFHKQFILDDWIYNPGSSEAVSSMDNNFRRGVFLVEVNYNSRFTKKVKIIRLNNRKSIWKTINFQKQIKRNVELYNYLSRELRKSLKSLNPDLEPSDLEMPVLYLILKGKEPAKSLRIKEKELREFICDNFPVVDARIYKKFEDSTTTIDKYF